jgi:hypothetical protein
MAWSVWLAEEENGIARADVQIGLQMERVDVLARDFAEAREILQGLERAQDGRYAVRRLLLEDEALSRQTPDARRQTPDARRQTQ